MSDGPIPVHASPADYAGLFLIAMATLMLEILLTRIFSVTMWYHLAFVAVSIAMFGMSLGSVVVYLLPRWFSSERAWINLSAGSALFAVSAIESVAIHLRTAIDPDAVTSVLLQLSQAYSLITVPFLFSGLVVSIALTKFPRQVSRLYAADLAGAAIGCVLLIVVLDCVGGPWTVSVVGGVAFAGAICFAWGSARATRSRAPQPSGRLAGLRSPRLWMTGAIVAAGVAMIAVMASAGGRLEIKYAKGAIWPKPIYEKWNSYSRVAITSDQWEEPFGWGLSFTYRPSYAVRQLHLNIDASC